MMKQPKVVTNKEMAAKEVLTWFTEAVSSLVEENLQRAAMCVRLQQIIRDTFGLDNVEVSVTGGRLSVKLPPRGIIADNLDVIEAAMMKLDPNVVGKPEADAESLKIRLESMRRSRGH